MGRSQAELAGEREEGAGHVEVRLWAPLDLPLTFPGSPQRAMIGASASAVVTVERD